MSLKINEKEIKAVINLPGDKRYEYFIKKVADTSIMWGLYNNGWALAEDDNGQKTLPFWPTQEYALLCAQEK